MFNIIILAMIEFNDKYLPLLNFIISLTGLVSLVLLIIQYKKDNAWKRLQSTYNFIGIGEELELQERLYSVYHKLNIYPFPEVCKPFTKKEVKLIRNDLEATLVTNMFLNHLQNLCTAYEFELVDEKVFYSIHSNRICWWYTILEPYIAQRKIDYKNPKIWFEFEQISNKCMASNKFK
ncbi:hypothetical protein GCM10011531_25870 [Aquaticitalea lipolytica]|jgi:hypothetical protein|uniref:DUF4760 domain-containing protein n=2 Tax=Aquaticitalea lipolytica TaxID=1247562 RepID=A0A8J2TU46_9FLAO|nr:hypothetical protein GCM10011531_25870 [Aquaticitalea lipolytica]